MKRNQQGITLTSFLFILMVVGAVLFVGMKLLPMYQEFYAVKAAMKGVAEEYSGKPMEPQAAQKNFFKRLDMNYVTSVKPGDVKFERIGSGWNMKVKYEVRKPMVANVDIVGNFEHEQAVGSSGR